MSVDPSPPAVTVRTVSRPKPAPYVPAIKPWLRPLLWGTFAGFAVLAATGVYMFGVTAMDWLNPGTTHQTPFNFLMIIAHGGIGLLGTLPFLVFGIAHYATSRHRKNRKAVRLGLAVFGLGVLVIMSGVALFQFDGLPKLPFGTVTRIVVYWLHVLIPVVCVAAYIGHRRAGPPIKWGYGKVGSAVTGLALVGMVALHRYDPQAEARKGSKDGVQYFEPSNARTGDGKFIPADRLMNDEYCMKCHQEIYNDHLHSSHKFSSFNNPAYLFSVKETREMGMKRDGHVKASRWCAGCHDPVPFFSGQFDDPNFDFEKHPTGHAGITCVVCHSITEVHGPQGNAAFTIEEQQQYPFTYSDNPFLQWINNQMVKAKPEFHKRTMLRPLHKSAEFCSTCHKVALPVELNHYKDFLRGQNHYDSFILSGMGNGSRSFYFPEQAKDNCASCHMPLVPSTDFGAKDRDGSGVAKVHDHRFPAANTGLFELLKNDPKYAHMKDGFDKTIKAHTDFLTDKKLRIDLFGVKTFRADGTVDDDSLTVLRPQLPALNPGETYLIETVIRTLNIGHHFSQGTVDSNEIWVDFTAKADGKVIGRNGATRDPDDTGPVDEWAHFVNVHMLDKDGRRIDRRNPQDIFTPLYDHQIPPGAANVVHYRLEVPKDVKGPVELTVRLRYRKFDHKYMEYVHKPLNRPIPKLPVVDLCSDTVTLPVAGGEPVKEQESPIKPAWQRWNDYGIACLIEGQPLNPKKGNLRQAVAAFQKLLTLGAKDAEWHGHANLARAYIDLGLLNDAAREVTAAGKADPPAPWWLQAWLSGLVSAQNATTKEEWDATASQFAKIVDPANQPRERNMNFAKDYVVLGRLGDAYFRRAQLEAVGSAEQAAALAKAIDAYERALAVDPEDLSSHYGLKQSFELLGVDAPNSGEAVAGTIDDAMTFAISLASADVTEHRTGLAVRLIEALTTQGRRPPDARTPRLKPLQEVRQIVRKAYDLEGDSVVKSALALALGTVHREIHALLKPDELARAHTTKLYRAGHPAANAAAEAIIIYPTNRGMK
jgi:tetratricopeptide (TPR) repeat protein